MPRPLTATSDWADPTRELDNGQLLGLIRKATPTANLKAEVFRDIVELRDADRVVPVAALSLDDAIPEELVEPSIDPSKPIEIAATPRPALRSLEPAPVEAPVATSWSPPFSFAIGFGFMIAAASGVVMLATM